MDPVAVLVEGANGDVADRPAIAVFDGTVRTIAIALLAVSAAYALLRKPLAAVGERLLERLPDRILNALPERFLPIEESDLERIDD